MKALAASQASLSASPMTRQKRVASKRTLREHCARALRGLARSPGSRTQIIVDGALAALVDVMGAADTDAIRLDCLWALAYLSAVNPGELRADATGMPMAVRSAGAPRAGGGGGVSGSGGVSIVFELVEPRLVSLLVDAVRSTTQETRCLLVTTLYNYSLYKGARDRMVSEGAVGGLVSLLFPKCSVDDEDKIAGLAPDRDAPLAVEDAFVIEHAVRALGNLSETAAGCLAITETQAIGALCGTWGWLSRDLKVDVVSAIVYNVSGVRSPGVILRAADEGACLILKAVVDLTRGSLSPSDVAAQRWSAVALARFACAPSAQHQVVRGEGVQALTDAVVASATGADAAAPAQVDVRCNAARAISTMLRVTRLAGVVAAQGACSALVTALGAGGGDAETLVHALAGLASALHAPASCNKAVTDGALRVIDAIMPALARGSNSRERAMAAMALHNASAHAGPRSDMIAPPARALDSVITLLRTELQSLLAAVAVATPAPPAADAAAGRPGGGGGHGARSTRPALDPSAPPAAAGAGALRVALSDGTVIRGPNAAAAATIAFATAALRNLSALGHVCAALTERGVVADLVTLLSGAPALTPIVSLRTIFDAVTVLANLSGVAVCRKQLMEDGVLPVLLPLVQPSSVASVVSAAARVARDLDDPNFSFSTAAPTDAGNGGARRHAPTPSSAAAARGGASDADGALEDELERRRAEAMQLNEGRVSSTVEYTRTACSNALTNMACDPSLQSRAVEFGVIPALLALSRLSVDGDSIRHRVTAALHMLSVSHDAARVMVRETLVPALVSMSSSKMEGVRRDCVGVLRNISMLPGTEGELVAAGVVPALMVLALLRSHDPTTQSRCMQTAHNLMAVPELRLPVLGDGVIWALQKLATAPDRRTQQICALTLSRLAKDAAAQVVLIRQGALACVVEGLKRLRETGPAAASALDLEIGALFASVLASMARQRGNEDLLIQEGGAEAMVLLSQTSLAGARAGAGGGGGGGGGAAGARGGGSDPAPAADAAAPPAAAAEAEEDVRHLRPAIALGLCRLSFTRAPGHRARLLNSGAPDVFAAFATMGDEAPETRSLALLGLCNVVWAGLGYPLLSTAIEALVDVLGDAGVPPALRYVAAVALHHLSSSEDNVEAITTAGGLDAIMRVLEGVSDAGGEGGAPGAALASVGPSPGGAVGGLDVAGLCGSALANLSAHSAARTDMILASGLTAAVARCLRRAVALADAARDGDAAAAGAGEVATALADNCCVVLAALSFDRSVTEMLAGAGAVAAVNAVLGAAALPAKTVARALILLRNLSWSRGVRKMICDLGAGNVTVPRLVALLVDRSEGDDSLLAISQHYECGASGLGGGSATVSSAGVGFAAVTTQPRRPSAAGSRAARSESDGAIALPSPPTGARKASGAVNDEGSIVEAAAGARSARLRAPNFCLKTDAVAVLCNMTREEGSRAVLLAYGAPTAILIVSELEAFDQRVRRACVRALCALSADSALAAIPEELEGSAPAAAAAPPSPSHQESVVQCGAVTALVAAMGARRAVGADSDDDEGEEEVEGSGGGGGLGSSASMAGLTAGPLAPENAALWPVTRPDSVASESLYVIVSARLAAAAAAGGGDAPEAPHATMGWARWGASEARAYRRHTLAGRPARVYEPSPYTDTVPPGVVAGLLMPAPGAAGDGGGSALFRSLTADLRTGAPWAKMVTLAGEPSPSLTDSEDRDVSAQMSRSVPAPSLVRDEEDGGGEAPGAAAAGGGGRGGGGGLFPPTAAPAPSSARGLIDVPPASIVPAEAFRDAVSDELVRALLAAPALAAGDAPPLARAKFVYGVLHDPFAKAGLHASDAVVRALRNADGESDFAREMARSGGGRYSVTAVGGAAADPSGALVLEESSSAPEGGADDEAGRAVVTPQYSPARRGEHKEAPAVGMASQLRQQQPPVTPVRPARAVPGAHLSKTEKRPHRLRGGHRAGGRAAGAKGGKGVAFAPATTAGKHDAAAGPPTRPRGRAARPVQQQRQLRLRVSPMRPTAAERPTVPTLAAVASTGALGAPASAHAGAAGGGRDARAEDAPPSAGGASPAGAPWSAASHGQDAAPKSGAGARAAAAMRAEAEAAAAASREAARENTAATRIQSRTRQYEAKKGVAKRRAALGRIQRNWRAVLTRRAFRAALGKGGGGGGGGSPFANAKFSAAMAFTALGLGEQAAAKMALEAMKASTRLVYGVVDAAEAAAAAAAVAALSDDDVGVLLGGASRRPPWRYCALLGAVLVLLGMPATMEDAVRVLTSERGLMGGLDGSAVLARQRRVAASLVHENFVGAKLARHAGDAAAAAVLRWVSAVIGSAVADTADTAGGQRRASVAVRMARRGTAGRLFVEDAAAMLARVSALELSTEVANATELISGAESVSDALKLEPEAVASSFDDALVLVQVCGPLCVSRCRGDVVSRRR